MSNETAEPVNKVEDAFDLLKQQYGTLATVCGILNISNSYVYRVIKEREMSYPCALKIEVLLDGMYTWRDLAPEKAAEVDSVKHRI